MTNIAFFVFWKAFAMSLVFCLILTPLVRWAALRCDILDRPSTPVKTHTYPVPYLGGVAVFASFALSVVLIRLNTAFPSGTLTALRGLLTGGVIIFALGLVDDVKDRGLHYRTKFLFQILAACLAVLFGIRLRFIHPNWVADVLTIVWIVGITNAFNLIDIMDGLASGVAGVATLAFLLIALPTEEIYVNVASAALCGSVLGFFPYNLSKRLRIFMGDSGSLVLGYTCSLLALGTSYSRTTQWAIFAPLLILCLPIFETCLLFVARIRKGLSPFVGSKDHFALRMEKLGWKRPAILAFALSFSAVLCLAAYAVTRVSAWTQLIIYCGAAIALFVFASYIAKAEVP